MEGPLGQPLYNAIAALIRQQIATPPDVGIILGSGLGAVAEQVEGPVTIPYHTLPAWPCSTVAGHHGELVVGRWANHTVAVLNGRAHYYEGYSMGELAVPVRVLRTLGVTRLIVTNAAGGLEPGFRAGDLMLITDHINLAGMAGPSPLRGPNDAALGPRFPDMTRAYDPALQHLARSVAKAKKMRLREGVYVMLAGPAYETPAEIRFLRLIGADAVGMSTVPEVVAACHAGMAVLGISAISNVAHFAPSAEKVSHDEVLAAGAAIGPRMRDLIGGVLAQL
ncbi:MAG TPA: purine-nucleoside phosphorylase [Anaerolineae bacterium]|nr:purine-nucleoside phosphorylase [Anaerolineae bacterium]HOQ97989.1 purine-nucleoside phosphorylase [Anaerolineae bacterium]HPL28500.1 purine-nucleoside phosphorylase [Anaerolineae bacterium]